MISIESIKQDFATGKITAAEYIMALELDNQAKAAKLVRKPMDLRLKITEAREPGTNGPEDKGTSGGRVSVYGLQRFPVTLGESQWRRLFGYQEAFLEFLDENAELLSRKD